MGMQGRAGQGRAWKGAWDDLKNDRKASSCCGCLLRFKARFGSPSDFIIIDKAVPESPNYHHTCGTVPRDLPDPEKP